jgi:hypothetical protein
MSNQPTPHAIAHAALVAEFGKGFHVGTLDLMEIEDAISSALIAHGYDDDSAIFEIAPALAAKFDGTVLA